MYEQHNHLIGLLVSLRFGFKLLVFFRTPDYVRELWLLLFRLVAIVCVFCLYTTLYITYGKVSFVVSRLDLK